MKDATEKERKRWRDAFLYFCRKVQLASGGAHKRLLLKSPVHTARVRMLHAMFPKVNRIPYTLNPRP
jgi:hypothetical protein